MAGKSTIIQKYKQTFGTNINSSVTVVDKQIHMVTTVYVASILAVLYNAVVQTTPIADNTQTLYTAIPK